MSKDTITLWLINRRAVFLMTWAERLGRLSEALHAQAMSDFARSDGIETGEQEWP